MKMADSVMIYPDEVFGLVFFSCAICPLVIPFLKSSSAAAYARGHQLNAYHKRRLELQR